MRLPVILEVNKTSKLKFQISDDLDLGIYEHSGLQSSLLRDWPWLIWTGILVFVIIPLSSNKNEEDEYREIIYEVGMTDSGEVPYSLQSSLV